MSVQPLTAAKFRELDSNGAPLSGGKLYTYAAGTTTPLATYTDSTGNTPNANPVILDSAGRADVWMTPGTLYKFVLQDSVGNIQYTEDNFQSSASGNAQLSQPNTFTAANTFSPAGTNTAAVTATGNGTGAAVVATGGASSASGAIFSGGAPNGHGIVSSGAGTGNAAVFTGGSSSGTGLTTTGGGPNGTGGAGVGTGSGTGFQGTGGASSGVGGVFTGGAPDGHGMQGIGAGTGYGGTFTPGVASTAAAPTNAILANNGNINISAANPNSTVGFANTITPKNVCKAWAVLHVTGGVASILDGFNVSSASISGGFVFLNFASAMSSTNYAPIVSGTGGAATVVVANPQTASQVAFSISNGAIVGGFIQFQDAATITATFQVSVFGAQ